MQSTVYKNNSLISFFSPLSKIPYQDKAQQETQARVFGDVSFNAVLAVDDPSAMSLVRQPGSDGFRLDSTALFQVSYSLLFLIPKDSEDFYCESAARIVGYLAL